MLSQRIYGLALGYEDVNDHEQLGCTSAEWDFNEMAKFLV
jgi:hypothetical protein